MDDARGQGRPVSPQPARLPDGKYYLLNIGINSYAEVRQLNNARPDSVALQELLIANYQFESGGGQLIPLLDEAATRGNIYQSLAKLAQIIQPNDSLLVYFAGHGIYNETWNQGFWIPVDGQPDRFDTYIPFTFLKSQLEAINSFHTLVIADACHAGAMFEMRDIKEVDEALIRLDRIPSRYLLTSGRNEVVPDGPEGSHSPFAGHLLEFLRNNPDELMSVADLARDLIRAVSVGTNPTPRAEPLPIKGHMGGEFIFRKKSYAFQRDEVIPPRRAYQFREVVPSDDPMAGHSSKMVPQVYNGDVKRFENIQALKKAIRSYITADDLLGAAGLFEMVLDEDGYTIDSIYQQQGRINRNKEAARLGTATQERIQVENNQIRFALLDYVRELEPDELKNDILGD